MRTTTILRTLLALQSVRVLSFEFDEEGIVYDVAPLRRLPRCSECGKRTRRGYDKRLAHDALDEVRRGEVRKAVGKDKDTLKRTRWALQKNPWNLVDFERCKLAGLQRSNGPIYRAYLLKETLLAVFDRRQINVAGRKLLEWTGWARRSRLPAFVKLAKTIEKHREGILAYVQTGANNGHVEGLNGKARTITRRSYGFHSSSALIAMLFLCCTGVNVSPAHVRPGFTH